MAMGRRGAERSAVVRQEAAERREIAKMSTEQRLSRLVEECQDELVSAFRAGLAGEPNAVERVRTAEMLLSRVLGKPKERTEHSLEMPSDTLAALSLPVADRLRLLAQLDPAQLSGLADAFPEASALARSLPAGDDAASVVDYADEPLSDS